MKQFSLCVYSIQVVKIALLHTVREREQSIQEVKKEPPLSEYPPNPEAALTKS